MGYGQLRAVGEVLQEGDPPLTLLDGETSEGNHRIIAGTPTGAKLWDSAHYRELWPNIDLSVPFGTHGFVEYLPGTGQDPELEGWLMFFYAGTAPELRRTGLFSRMFTQLETLAVDQGYEGVAALEPQNGVEDHLEGLGYGTYHGFGGRMWMRQHRDVLQDPDAARETLSVRHWAESDDFAGWCERH